LWFSWCMLVTAIWRHVEVGSWNNKVIMVYQG